MQNALPQCRAHPYAQFWSQAMHYFHAMKRYWSALYYGHDTPLPWHTILALTTVLPCHNSLLPCHTPLACPALWPCHDTLLPCHTLLACPTVSPCLFMDRLDMSVAIALCCCLKLTLRAQVLDSFMDWLYMLVEMALLCCLILTFRAGVLNSFVDILDILVEMALLCCLIITFRARVLHFVMNCLMVLVDILLESWLKISFAAPILVIPPVNIFNKFWTASFFIFLPISNFRKIYKGPPFEYFVNVIIQTLEN